jgi:hypothetical protein
VTTQDRRGPVQNLQAIGRRVTPVAKNFRDSRSPSRLLLLD